VRKWLPIFILGLAQFVMVLDGTVMNVSITTVVDDLGTTVSAMQLAIATFTLTMAGFMLAGAGLGDRLGRRRAFVIGTLIYGAGSLITSVAPNFAVLFVGWSIIEGLGAVLVIPAIAALAAVNYEGRDRAVAYGILGGIAGAAAAAGPLIGGWVTSEFSWRWVFAAETIIILAVILPLTHTVRDGARKSTSGRFDFGGVALSAIAMGLVVLALVSASTWGLIRPIDPPFEVVGFSPVLPVVLLGLVVARLFFAWERRLPGTGRTPLIGMDLLGIGVLRSGLGSILVMYFTVAGTFFILPLYLQTVLGLDAFESGLRILPMSVAIFVMAIAGSRLSARVSPRTLVQAGLGLAATGVAFLIGAITAEARGTLFVIAMAVIGVGLGLALSQIGNVNLSAADSSRSSEIGGLQGTAQNLGSSLGVALAGTVLFIGLANTFTTNLAEQPGVNQELEQAAERAVARGVQVVPARAVETAAQEAGLPTEQVDAVVTAYSDAKLTSLRAALAVVFVTSVFGLLVTGGLPRKPLAGRAPPGAGSGS
jgi:EmrB/QacA subfamily drug resistance transporter